MAGRSIPLPGPWPFAAEFPRVPMPFIKGSLEAPAPGTAGVLAMVHITSSWCLPAATWFPSAIPGRHAPKSVHTYHALLEAVGESSLS